jgi:RNA polymerase sigma factor (sigma-70 family)
MERQKTMRSSDATIISPRLSVEQKAFYERVYQQYKGDVYRFLLRHGLTSEQAGDMLHDVYYRVIRQNEPSKLEQWPKAYLLKIAINLLRDKSRRAKTGAVVYENASEYEPEMSVVDLSPEKQLQQTQQLQIIKQAIQELSDKQRKIFILHRFDNMTCKEISKEIGIPLRSVQRYLGESLAYCQRKLDRENRVRR